MRKNGVRCLVIMVVKACEKHATSKIHIFLLFDDHIVLLGYITYAEYEFIIMSIVGPMGA